MTLFFSGFRAKTKASANELTVASEATTASEKEDTMQYTAAVRKESRFRLEALASENENVDTVVMDHLDTAAGIVRDEAVKKADHICTATQAWRQSFYDAASGAREKVEKDSSAYRKMIDEEEAVYLGDAKSKHNVAREMDVSTGTEYRRSLNNKEVRVTLYILYRNWGS